MLSAFEFGKLAASFGMQKQGFPQIGDTMTAGNPTGGGFEGAYNPPPPNAPPGASGAVDAVAGAAAGGRKSMYPPRTFGKSLSKAWRGNPLRGLMHKHPFIALALGLGGGLGVWNMLRTGSPLSHGADQYGLMDDPNISKMREAYMRGPEGQFGGLDPASGRWMQNALGAAGLRHRQVSNMFKAQREAFQD